MKYNKNLKKVMSYTIAGAVLSGCGAPEETCNYFLEPGTYQVKPCDVFAGPLGVNFRADELDKYGQIRGSYIDEKGNAILTDQVLGAGLSIAHYGLKLYREKNGAVVLADDPNRLYDRCVQYLSIHPEADPANHCSIVSPTEALEGEVIVESESGYFGKTNDSAYSQLAECAARDVESVVLHTSSFLRLPRLHKGISYMHIFKDKTPQETGFTTFSISVWFYKKDDWEVINYAVAECKEKMESGIFSKGDHELTHLFVNKFNMPFTFNEGFANYVPTILNGQKPEIWETKGEQWNTAESICKEDGFKKGYEMHPYISYQKDPKTYDSYLSGECFWQKLVYDYSLKIIPKIMDVFEINYGKDKTFEENLLQAGINTAKYHPWGLGEN